jgi:hypothetical protein
MCFLVTGLIDLNQRLPLQAELISCEQHYPPIFDNPQQPTTSSSFSQSTSNVDQPDALPKGAKDYSNIVMSQPLSQKEINATVWEPTGHAITHTTKGKKT